MPKTVRSQPWRRCSPTTFAAKPMGANRGTATYRIYSLDSEGHIGLADWIHANSDEEQSLRRESFTHMRRGSKNALWRRSTRPVTWSLD